MNHNLKNQRIISIILFIFFISFSLYTIFIYFDTKNELEILKVTNKQQVDNLYENLENSLSKQLQSRLHFILTLHLRQEKIEAIKKRDRHALYELFKDHFESLQTQIDGFNVMNILDSKGNVLLRVQEPNFFGDDISKKRAVIRDVVQSPRVISFFEVGSVGLAYRSIAPVYDKGELLGFLELGTSPHSINKSIETIFRSKVYFFVKQNNFFNHEGLKLPHSDYFLCHICSKEDTFIKSVTPEIKLQGITYQNVSFENKTFSIVYKNIFDSLKNNVGQIIIFYDITFYTQQLENMIFKSIFLMCLTLFLIYLILSRYITKVYEILNFSNFLLNNVNDKVMVVDAQNLHFLDANSKVIGALGYTKEELQKKNIKEIIVSMNTALKIDWERRIQELQIKTSMVIRDCVISKRGKMIPIESNISYILHGEKKLLLFVARNITKQLQLEKHIKEKANELQRLNDIISKSALYTTTDLEGNITYISDAFARLTGYDKNELIGENHRLFKHTSMSKEFFDKLWETISKDRRFVGEVQNFTKDGGSYWTKIIIDPIFNDDGKKIGYSSYRENITDKKELEYISRHDPLTNLYNRRAFMEQLQREIKSATRYKEYFGFIIFDIDHFKKINDTYGHQVGDIVLVNLSQIVKSNLRDDDFLARWGGEEFVIIAKCKTKEELQQLVEKLQGKISKGDFSPVVSVTCSFGITQFLENDNDESLIKRADIALYRAKKNGRDRFEIE